MDSKNIKKFFPYIAAGGLVVLVLIGVGLYFLILKPKSSPAVLTDAQKIEAMVKEVSKFISLPDEMPTMATVTDINKLKDQPFFQKSKNGDVVLLYPKSQKAYLYDPQAKKLLDVAPFNVSTESAKENIARISVKNGTKVKGLAAKLEEVIKKQYPEVGSIKKGNANKDNYPKTLAIVLNEKARPATEELAKKLDASVSALPKDEEEKEADILIIIGEDRVE